jgi:CRISPR/Cas system-associated endonuclease Cas3-HD
MTDAARNAPQPIQTAAEAENLIHHLLTAMGALVATVEQETELVRAGKLKDAISLDAAKAELARAYVNDTAQVKANLPLLKKQVPDLLAALRKQHDTFNALLQINLTVLATAHAVSEGLIRGAHSEVARKNAPQTYGNSGRPVAPPKNAAVPVSVSRTL